MKRAAMVVTILFALLAFGIGFVGATVALDITRPVVSDSTATVQFVVNDGDNVTDVANNLQKAGLIHNALVFRLFARFKLPDGTLKHGTYNISPGMTMDQIIIALEGAPVDESIAILVPPGLRITQYPTYLSKLHNFNGDNFLKIAQTGILLDDAKTPISSKYWFVQKPGKGVKYALEGYLFPDTYSFNKDDDETTVIETMLNNLGEHLCPGPTKNVNSSDEYFTKKDQCLAHAAKVGNTTIFSAMQKAYATKDDVAALQMTLTFASLTVREIDAVKYPKDAVGVTNVYFTRYMAVLQKTPNLGDVYDLGSDPTVLYALDSANPPKDGKWWNQKLLVGNLADLAKTDPYNTYVVSGLPPGPIAAPLWADIEAAATPGISKYFYFIQDCHGTTLYATTLDEHQANQDKPCS